MSYFNDPSLRECLKTSNSTYYKKDTSNNLQKTQAGAVVSIHKFINLCRALK